MNAPLKQCRVAILMIDKRPFHEVMANFLFDEINVGDTSLYTASICSMMPNKDSIRYVVSSLLEQNKADVFITIGETCSVVTKQVLDEQGGHPMIFVGVRDPVGLKLINSLDRPGFCLSGIIREPAPILTVAEYFAPLYPAVRNVLIPYSQDDAYLLNQAREMKRYFSTVGINALIVAVDSDPRSVMEVISDNISRVQGLIVLEACHSSGLQEEIAFLCWEKCVVFCGSGSYAIDAGAACALGGSLRWIAEEAYKMLRQHWEEHQSLGFVPVRILPDNQEFCVNVDMMRRLDAPIDAIERICNQPKVKKDRKWTMPFKE